MSFFLVTLDVGMKRFMCVEDAFSVSMTMFLRGVGWGGGAFKKDEGD